MLFKDNEVARKEAKAIRENVGWYRWTHDLLEVKGKDADAFIEYLYVNNMGKAVIGKTKYTTMLNEDGKIIDDTIVMHMGEHLFWVSTLYAPQFIKWADAHKGDYEVEYRDISTEIDMYAVQGPNSLKIMNDLLETPIDDMKRFTIADNKISGIDVKIHRSGFTGELGYEIYVNIEETDKIEKILKTAEDKFNAVEVRTLEVYVRSIPVEKGFALRQDMYGLSPYECDLGWSVCMDKDFIGKEALIKEKEEGSKYKLVGLEYLADSYEDIAQKEIVYKNGVPCGFVRAAIYGYTVEKNIGFAVMEARKVVIGERVTVGDNDSPAIVCEKTFI